MFKSSMHCALCSGLSTSMMFSRNSTLAASCCASFAKAGVIRSLI